MQTALIHRQAALYGPTMGNATKTECGCQKIAEKAATCAEVSSKCENSLGGGGGGGGDSPEIWVEVCDTIQETVTLFQTKVCNFPYPGTASVCPKI